VTAFARPPVRGPLLRWRNPPATSVYCATSPVFEVERVDVKIPPCPRRGVEDPLAVAREAGVSSLVLPNVTCVLRDGSS